MARMRLERRLDLITKGFLIVSRSWGCILRASENYSDLCVVWSKDLAGRLPGFSSWLCHLGKIFNPFCLHSLICKMGMIIRTSCSRVMWGLNELIHVNHRACSWRGITALQVLLIIIHSTNINCISYCSPGWGYIVTKLYINHPGMELAF